MLHAALHPLYNPYSCIPKRLGRPLFLVCLQGGPVMTVSLQMVNKQRVACVAKMMDNLGCCQLDQGWFSMAYSSFPSCRAKASLSRRGRVGQYALALFDTCLASCFSLIAHDLRQIEQPFHPLLVTCTLTHHVTQGATSGETVRRDRRPPC